MKSLFLALGLTQKETDVFLKMLELGAQPVSHVARHVGIPRSTMYLVLDRLRDLQLIEEFDRNGIKQVQCIPVSNIVDVLRAKERMIDQSLQALTDALPELQKLQGRLSITPKVKFFEGKEAVMTMYEEVLKEKTFDAYFNPASIKRVMPEYHYKIPETLRTQRGSARELLVDGKEAREYRRKFFSDTHQIKLLPSQMQFESDTIICSERIYMISYGESQISAIEIFNPSLARTQQMVFEELWKTH